MNERGLSSEEKRALARLVKREQDWHRDRWIYLVLCAAMFFLHWKFSAKEGEILEALARPGGERFDVVFLPLLARYGALHFTALLFGVAGLSYVIVHWHGSPVRKLLIRLASREDEEQLR